MFRPYKDIVDIGVSKLDEYFAGEDWRSQIDVENLDMRGTYTCVLGQLFDSYNKGIYELSSDLDEPFAKYGWGFTLPMNRTTEEYEWNKESKRWRQLTKEWKRRINPPWWTRFLQPEPKTES